jgi:annexin A7/11
MIVACAPLAACVPGYAGGYVGPDGYGAPPPVAYGAPPPVGYGYTPPPPDYGYVQPPVIGYGGGYYGDPGRNHERPDRDRGPPDARRENLDRPHPQQGYNQRPPRQRPPGPPQQAAARPPGPPPSPPARRPAGQEHRPE